MGGPMARHLKQAGHELTVYNRSRAKAENWVATYGGTLALSPAVAGSGAQFAVIPSAWHQPLVQRMVLLKGASVGAKNFYAFLASSASRVVFERYGFSIPQP